jgi:hypothetical protein
VADNQDNNKVIVSRIQQRRGQKQDLPQPLRSAEFGFTTDSRQVFIGGDPTDQTATYNKNLSYFETTLSAQEHTLSIANNQIIAFTVPFIKYSKGKFDGISNLRQWEANDARTSVEVDLACDHISSSYSVFPPIHTGSFNLAVTSDFADDNSITLSYDGYNENPIRIGDAVYHPSIEPAVPGVPITVTAIPYDNALLQECTIKITGYKNPIPSINGLTLQITRGNIKNFITGQRFTSRDVIVHKNGIRLTAETRDEIVAAPTPQYDYAFDATNTISTAAHSLTLRTPPNTTDDITLCYYSNVAVVQALTGVAGGDGKRYVTNNVPAPYRIESFYSEYSLPEFLQIDPNLIRVSETTGLGFIGLERKHISSIAFGSAIANPNSVTLGNLYVARDDDQRRIDGAVTLVDPADPQIYTFELSIEADNVFSPVSESGVDTTYRYNRVRFAEKSNVDSYIQKVACDVITVNNVTSEITVSVPTVIFDTARPATATLANRAGNYYGENGANSSIITITVADTAGIQGRSDDGLGNIVSAGDRIRILDDSGDPANCEIHDTVFEVLDTPTATTFNVRISNSTIYSGNLDSGGNVVTSFTRDYDNIKIVNHGNANNMSGSVDNVIQLYSPYKHGMEIDPGNVRILSADPDVFVSTPLDTEYDFDTNGGDILRDQAQKTVFIEIDTMLPANQLDVSGGFLPYLEASYADLSATPVLSVDLSTATTVRDALAIVNKDLVTIKTVSGTDIVSDIIAQLELIPGTTNQLMIKQDPSYSSVQVGGLEFTLFEDQTTPTLSVLGFDARVYNRENDTVRAKLERWLNKVAGSRNLNLFSRVMTIGRTLEQRGATVVGVPTTYTDYRDLSNINLGDNITPYKTYPVLIDEVFKEIQFCDIREASNFNFIVNNAYAESLYDRNQDRFRGVRGLLNLKNNIELLTRESGILFGERQVTFSSPFDLVILKEKPANEYIEGFSFELNRYDSFIIDYTISDDNDPFNKYSRTGEIRVQVRPDIIPGQTSVTFYDNYSSQWEINNPPLNSLNQPVLNATSFPDGLYSVFEPKFNADYIDGGIFFYMLEYSELLDQGAQNTAHSINADLVIRYAYRRTSSLEN